METPALKALRLESAQTLAMSSVRATLPDSVARVVSTATIESVVLTTDTKTHQPVLVVQTPDQRMTFAVPTNPALTRVLEVNPQIPMNLQVNDSGEIVLTSVIQRPEPAVVILRGGVSTSVQTPPHPSLQASSDSPHPIPATMATPVSQALTALSQVTPERVTVALLNHGPMPSRSPDVPHVESSQWRPMQVARAVADSIQSLGGVKPVLIPDISPAIPRPMTADAMPAQMPIRQPIADELGLKVGQVVQALVASSKGQQHMQFGNQQLPVPQGMRLPQGEVMLRVVQTTQGLALAPQLSTTQPQAVQSAAISGLSAALAAVIAKPSARPATQSAFAVGGLEAQLAAQGLGKEAQLLQTNRLSSQQLTGQQIASAVKFGGLMNEKAIAEGIGFQSGMLKPWLRQLLRLLPHQSELSIKLMEVISELESFQLESLPQSGSRDQGLSALLLFKDQPPVELIFERHDPDDEHADQSLWVVNLHTSLETLGDVWLRSGFSGTSVDLMFWASDPKTAELARHARYDLEEALSEHGLTVKNFQLFDVPRPGHERLNPEGLPHTDVSA